MLNYPIGKQLTVQGEAKSVVCFFFFRLAGGSHQCSGTVNTPGTGGDGWDIF